MSGRNGPHTATDPTWDPELYLSFRSQRTRPALDLLDRVRLASPRRIVDLGCGPGHLTAELHDRWPTAHIEAVDRSAEMLERARADHPDLPVDWLAADIAGWAPAQPVDLILSNATLHWLDDHASLFPRLVGALRDGGVLAVQMPRNHDEPTHRAAVEVAREGPWADDLLPLLRERPVAEPQVLHDVLRPHVSSLDVWETTYLHELPSSEAVAAWTRGSVLRPLLQALDEADRAEFEARYLERIRAAYPRRSTGAVLMPFRRQFVVAVR